MDNLKGLDDFDFWNNTKKKLETTTLLDKFPKEGEIWMSAFGKNIGFEQNGSGDSFSRPVLVIKRFNNHMFLIVPLSTKQKAFDFYFNYTDSDNNNVSIILTQIKLFSIKRFKRKMGNIDPNTLSVVKNKIKSFF